MTAVDGSYSRFGAKLQKIKHEKKKNLLNKILINFYWSKKPKKI
jgi:hypothetical protein